MLVNYSSSSEDEIETAALKKITKRLPSCHCDDSPRKKQRSDAGIPIARASRHTCNDHESISTGAALVKECHSKSDEVPSRLPLPGTVLDMFTGEVEDPETEDSSLHEGRIRSFRHERGNWATHVFFPYFPDEEFLELLDEMMEVAASHGVPLTRVEDYHLSLSQTVVLKHHWIQPFVQSLRTGLAHCRRFLCSADKLRVYSNAEKTRTFLGMEVSTGHAQLLELMKIVDRTMEEFRLDTFYQNPSFHVSLAWCVGDFADHICSSHCLTKLQSLVDSDEDGHFLLTLRCQELRCRSGNKTFSLPLVS